MKRSLIYNELERKSCSWGGGGINREPSSQSFYASLSAFGRVAVLVGLFLDTRFVTKQLKSVSFQLGCHLYCRKQPSYFPLLSKITRDQLWLILHFHSTDAGGLSQPLAALGSEAEMIRRVMASLFPRLASWRSPGRILQGCNTGTWGMWGPWFLIDFTLMLDL